MAHFMITQIISGGQTGADRAALDVALKLGIPHGGWIPKGRKAEDAPLPELYKLKEMPTDSYGARTEQNVLDSDGTLIIARGKLTGGSDYTRQMTLKHKKHLLYMDLNIATSFDAASIILSWAKLLGVKVLNVAGPRASEDISIYEDVLRILEMAYMMHNVEQKRSVKKLPKSVDEAIKRLISELSLKDKTSIANMAENDLVTLQTNLGAYIGSQFGIWSGNRQLLDSCSVISHDVHLQSDFAPSVIIKELWKCLRVTHKLRVVK